MEMGLQVHGTRQVIKGIQQFRETWGKDSAWIVGVGAEYGAYVEFGTSRMQEQPYLFPAARHVMRSQFGGIEQQAGSPEELVSALAHAIEAEAKRRAPVDTGHLRSSITAVRVG